MKKIRINELAREVEVKAAALIELLPRFGVTEKKTHSSSLDEDVAERIRHYFATGEVLEQQAAVPAAAEESGAASAVAEQEAAPAVSEPAPAASEPAPPAKPEPKLEPPVSAPSIVEQRAPAAAEPAEQLKIEKFEAPALGVLGETGISGGRPLRPPVAGQPLRPPLATGPRRPVVPPLAGGVTPSAPSQTPPPAPAPAPAPPPAAVSAPPTVAPPVAPPPKVETPAPRPGQILSGPNQPLPARLAEQIRPGVTGPTIVQPPPTPGAPRPLPPRQPLAPRQPLREAPAAGVVRPAPAAGGAPGQPQLAGQPTARPVVPPRPDVVARLMQTKAAPAAKPGMPKPASPVPGQPIYRGPIRPGQPIVGRAVPGMPPAGATPGAPPAGVRRGRGAHPTALRPEPVVVPTTETRRPTDKRRQVERDVEREEFKGVRRPASRTVEDTSTLAAGKEVAIAEGITVKELSEKLGVRANLVIKKLVERKIFATINQTLDAAVAESLAASFGATTSRMTFEEEAIQEVELAEDPKDLQPRPPVVTVMGHVDHGKTSLLDALRSTNVAEREAGGITQHIGAYHVELNGRKIVFIDTPGHEAFTRMRARGAQVTDVVILVVAADDGVMPQTLEAIDHAKAAGVPIVVAINKIDKPEAQPDRVKQQLADRGLVPEEWGGDTVMVPVSAKQRQNLNLLLEMVLLVSDMLDLKANPNRPAVGTVLEAKLDRGRGPVATLLVRNGTLRVGDYYICGSVFGRVRAMFDAYGASLREAGPATPVEILGLESLPEVGDTLQVVTDTAKAKQIVIYREAKAREQAMAKTSRLTLDQLHEQIRAGEVKELPIVIKADVSGSAEVLAETLQKLSTDKVKIRVIHSGVGAITETDVLLASTSNAVIIGFNVRPDRNAAALAEQEKVDVRLHTIIYEVTEEVKKAMAGLLEPVFKEIYKGRAEVREVFRISKVGMVAGCYVQDGVISRDSQVRLLRDNVVIYTGKVSSLRRFKDDVAEVRNGMECGIALANFSDVKPGDIIEAFVTERVATEALA